MSAAIPAEQVEAAVAGALARLAGAPGPLLEVLIEVQRRIGCIPDSAVAPIADALNLSRAEVHGVRSFYPMLRREPRGRHLLQLCRAEACMARGARILERQALARLAVHWRGTTPDGAVTLEPVYCLGLCACSPALLADGEPMGHVTAERLDALLDGWCERQDTERDT
jgi:formate dehydrogenase subunit gamma